MRDTKLEPRTKILMMLISGCLVILLDSPTALLVCFLGGLALVALSVPTWAADRVALCFPLLYDPGVLILQPSDLL